jgi:hypothetical protein
MKEEGSSSDDHEPGKLAQDQDEGTVVDGKVASKERDRA